MGRCLQTSFVLIVCGWLATIPAVGQESPPVAGIDANKALVRRYLEEVLTAGRFGLLDEIVSPEFVDRTPGAEPDVRGPEVVRRAQRRARQFFEEVRYTIDDLVAEGDRVAARYTVRALRKPTGESDPAKPIEVIGITLFRIESGKIREAWIVNDQIELFRQLGFTLAPAEKEPPKPKPLPGLPPQPAG
jgi:SnoaL-like polyketide cyclase